MLQLPTFSSFPHQPCEILCPIPSPQAWLPRDTPPLRMPRLLWQVKPHSNQTSCRLKENKQQKNWYSTLLILNVIFPTSLLNASWLVVSVDRNMFSSALHQQNEWLNLMIKPLWHFLAEKSPYTAVILHPKGGCTPVLQRAAVLLGGKGKKKVIRDANLTWIKHR